MARLGPFELTELIAKGGMGEVWAARHLAEDLEVAIKVITADYARHPGFQASLRHEVRAMATLSHPHIVRVLDQGEINERAATETDYQLVEGSPYIAMEMVRGATLADQVLALQWNDVRDILIKLLGALGHAHARNVLHRDLKPANLLIAEGGTTWDIKLTDFGIAHPLRSSERTGPRVAGTPHFMAPEQQAGDWRRYRASTDLYSVGRIASALLVRDDQNRAFVPPGFNEWMARMVANEPHHRFPFAADAAWALRQMGPPTAVLDPAFVPGSPPTATRVEADTTLYADPHDEQRTLFKISLNEIEVPPIPRTWRMPIPKPPTRQMKNAGAGLFGIRNIELVGRPQERTSLWKLLHKVAAESQPHVMLIRGPEGIGKASLVRWFRRRAHEVGAAWGMHAVFSPVAGDGSPLSSMTADSVNTNGLSHDEAVDLITLLTKVYGGNEYDIAALLELAHPAPPERENTFRFANVEEREVAVCRYLEWWARRRPVVVHFDHVQWGAEGLRVVLRAVQRARRLRRPLLFALTCDDQQLRLNPIEQDLIAQIREAGGIRVHDIELGPLPPSAQRALIASLLGLDPALVAETADLTQGHPLQAIQQVKRWHEDGALEEGPTGLRLVHGATRASASMSEIWNARLDQFMRARSEPSRIALELMAVLGNQVTENDWARLCRRAGVKLTRTLVDDLLTSGLLRARRPKVYQFAHPSLRTTVTDQADEAGRLEAHHISCADLLMRHGRGPNRLGRIGQHLLAGGQPVAALNYLSQGAGQAIDESSRTRARELLALWEQALEASDLPASDPVRGDGLELLARLATVSFDATEVRKNLNKLEEVAQKYNWEVHLARIAAARARLALHQGDASECLRLLPRAMKLADACKDHLTGARCRLEMAQLLTQQGLAKSAAPMIAQARTLYETADNPLGEANCLILSASIAYRAGRLDEALALADSARHLGKRAGAMSIQGYSLSIAGEVHRMAGRADMARKAYHKALRLFHSIGAEDHGIPCELNLAQLHQDDGEDEAALDILQACIERLHRTQRAGLEAIAHCLVLPSLARRGNKIAYERHLTRGAELYDRNGFRDPDALRALSNAAREARRRRWMALAEQTDALHESML